MRLNRGFTRTDIPVVLDPRTIISSRIKDSVRKINYSQRMFCFPLRIFLKGKDRSGICVHHDVYIEIRIQEGSSVLCKYMYIFEKKKPDNLNMSIVKISWSRT